MPWPLHKLLAGHECATTQQRGWAGIKNGELLRPAEAEFDLFVTADQGIRYQQNLADRKSAILELATNDLRRILAAGALIQQAALSHKPGEYRRLAIP